MKIKPGGWLVIILVLAASAFFATKRYAPDFLNKLKGGKTEVASSVAPKESIPALPDIPNESPLATPTPVAKAALPGDQPGCTSIPEVRVHEWAWNSQMGWMFANGGIQSTAGSLMCQSGVNLRFIRQDDVPKMREALIAFATELASGVANPTKGVHFVAIMGDGVAGFIQPLNVELAKYGMRAKVVGSAGWSRGEDKFMGLPAWRQDPQQARGALISGYVGDGDWNIAVDWAVKNDICNNPDWTTHDPSCLNWVNADNYIDAAQKYVANYCEDRPVVKNGKKTGATARVCVNGVVTWTPGDVTVAEQKGGLVSILSTKENRAQMPNAIIGVDRWMAANRSTVEGMLAAIFAGGDQVKSSVHALSKAAAISAVVYGEQDTAYWETYFYGITKRDAKGLSVELGGSAVNNLADNLYLFGLAGGMNLFDVTYTRFGKLLHHYYPDMLPSVPVVSEILDTSYVEALAKRQAPTTTADVPQFANARPVESERVSQKSWHIEFASGSATPIASGKRVLNDLAAELALATGTFIDVEGHTDSDGDAEKNQVLSEARAFAVKQYLQSRDRVNFPDQRIRVAAYGESRPVAPNSSAAGKAQNRRVEIVTRRIAGM